ncbi:NTF2-related export protein 2 [Protopterus annectens]|uniref:NTF2-related export protein 2 n=1 Tax=Protopterus annectens TaxID=7888 RepID=UPI001CFA3D7E|nr:NTF2-related export protein 2 [Protopterus annectens]
MSSSTVEFKVLADQACKAAEEFIHIYYETMDKRRTVLPKLYMDTASLIWNGNAVSGQKALAEFLESLPASEFTVTMLDCQPVHEEVYSSVAVFMPAEM